MDLAEILPDVNNFAGKCWDLGSVGFLRVLKRKSASRSTVFGFWKPRSSADRRNDRVGRFRIGCRSDPPGGSGLGWVWTALPLTTKRENFIGEFCTCIWLTSLLWIRWKALQNLLASTAPTYKSNKHQLKILSFPFIPYIFIVHLPFFFFLNKFVFPP